MRPLFLVLASATLIAAATQALAHEETKGGVTVAHPWVRATPGGATIGVAYLEIKTADGIQDRLIGASSPVAARAEIHTHIKEGDVMRMRKVEAIALKPKSSAVLKPSGDHVMLMDLKAPLKEGDLVKLTLVFEKAGAIEVEASVEPVGAMGPHGMPAQPVDASADHGAHKH